MCKIKQSLNNINNHPGKLFYPREGEGKGKREKAEEIKYKEKEWEIERVWET